MANHLLNPALLRTLVKPGAYPDGEGLYLRVRGPQQRAWAFRYMLRGKATWMGLGPYPDVGLAAAREKATAARQQAKSGTDPLADKRARQAAAMATEEREKAAAKADARTFRTAAEEYLRLNEGGWRNAKHAAQWPSTLAAYVYPVIGDKPLAASTPTTFATSCSRSGSTSERRPTAYAAGSRSSLIGPRAGPTGRPGSLGARARTPRCWRWSSLNCRRDENSPKATMQLCTGTRSQRSWPTWQGRKASAPWRCVS